MKVTKRWTMAEHQKASGANKCYGCLTELTGYSAYGKLAPDVEVKLCQGRSRDYYKQSCFELARDRQPMCPTCGEPYEEHERWSLEHPCCAGCVTRIARVKEIDAAERKDRKARGVGKTEWYRIKPSAFFPYIPGDAAKDHVLKAVKALVGMMSVGPVATDPKAAGGWIPQERWVPANASHDTWDRNVELFAQLSEKQAAQLTDFAHRLEALVTGEFTRGQQDGKSFIVGLAEGRHTIAELEAVEVRLAGRQRRIEAAVTSGEKIEESHDDRGYFGR